MCKGSSASSTIDGRVWDLLNANVQHAQRIANAPFQPYTGDLRAPMNAAQKQAGDYLNDWQNQGFSPIHGGQVVAGNVANYAAPQIGATMANAATASPGMVGVDYRNFNNLSNEMLSPLNTTLSPHGALAPMAEAASINRGDVRDVPAQTGLGHIGDYLNPYTRDVIDTTLSDMNRARQMSIAGNQATATQAGAYGGSRHGIADAETNRNFIDQAAQTAAQLRSAGFNTAAGLMQSDYDRALQAGSANQAADLSIAGQNAGFGQQAGMFNAQNAIQNNQFNAGVANDIERQNAANALQNAQFNAGQYLQSGLFNAGAYNDLAKYNAANQQAANLFNAQAANQVGLSNQDAAMRAAQANQQASLAGAGVDLQGAGLLGTLGTQQLQNYLQGANALNQFGTQAQQSQQAALDAAYQQYLRQFNYPVDMQQVLNSSLGLFGSANGTKSNDTGSMLGGMGSLLGGIAAF